MRYLCTTQREQRPLEWAMASTLEDLGLGISLKVAEEQKKARIEPSLSVMSILYILIESGLSG